MDYFLFVKEVAENYKKWWNYRTMASNGKITNALKKNDNKDGKFLIKTFKIYLYTLNLKTDSPNTSLHDDNIKKLLTLLIWQSHWLHLQIKFLIYWVMLALIGIWLNFPYYITINKVVKKTEGFLKTAISGDWIPTTLPIKKNGMSEFSNPISTYQQRTTNCTLLQYAWGGLKWISNL